MEALTSDLIRRGISTANELGLNRGGREGGGKWHEKHRRGGRLEGKTAVGVPKVSRVEHAHHVPVSPLQLKRG